VAPSFGVEVSPMGVRDAPEIERAVTAFARSSNGGLIVFGGPLAQLHRELIITLAAQHRTRELRRFVNPRDVNHRRRLALIDQRAAMVAVAGCRMRSFRGVRKLRVDRTKRGRQGTAALDPHRTSERHTND
jgi:hypothetical protein